MQRALVGSDGLGSGLACSERSDFLATFTERVKLRQTELSDALERFVAVARTFADVHSVYVFGSLATGKIVPRSDLDILVVRETALRGPERGADLVSKAQLGIELDLIVVTPAEFTDRLPLTSFGRTLLATAKLAYAA